MKKKLPILFILLIGLFLKGQDNSIAASVNTPISYQTGVPDISYPLASLPATKDFTLNFGLTYNPNSYKMAEFCGQIARNWSLAGSNFMITRKIVSFSDEQLTPDLEWDDIYYYNINGEQGSFRIERTGTYQNFVYKLIKLTPNNVTIDFIRTQPTSPVMNAFTITDGKGYKYYFQDHDSQKTQSTAMFVDYTNAIVTFYINKIEDPAGQVVATFQNKRFSGSGVWTYMPEIITTNYGKIIIEHGDGGADWNFNDRYYFKNFTLRDYKGNFISKYDLDIIDSSYRCFDTELFQSSDIQTIKVRKLNMLKKLDKNSNIIEIIKFNYTHSPPSSPAWGSYLPQDVYQKDDFLLHDLLNTVTLPSGSYVSYKFGAHTLKLKDPIDFNTPEGINSIQDIDNGEIPPFSFKKKTDSIPYDSHITNKYYLTNLQKSPRSRIYVYFHKDEIYPWSNPENPWKGSGNPEPKLAYKVKNYTNYDPTYGAEIEDFYAPRAYVVPSDGTAYLEITGTGGNGWFEIYEKDWLEPPYIRLNENAISKTGVRIEQINYYNNSPGPYNTTIQHLIKTIDFDYGIFNNIGASSGEIVYDEEYETIIYKNVKVTESDKPGYTKYYYKTYYDFPLVNHPTIPGSVINVSYNFTKKGILDKKETYDSNGVIKNSNILTYIFPPYDLEKLYLHNFACTICTNNQFSHSQESFPEKVKTEETSYDSYGNSLTDSSEKTFNQDNNNLMKERKTTADGTVMETEYQYAAEKGNAKLLGANMFSVPLEVTQKQNGIQIGKLETRYDQSGNYFPSSVTSFGINNVITGEQTNEIYDNMGNVLQTRSKSGMPTAVIWGYGRTQPIAKIEGGEYYNILALIGQTDVNLLDIVQKSNLDVDSSNDANEQLLRNALEAFRRKPEFKTYLITTYTYDPLIGVKSVTSPNGMTEYYYYDNQNKMIRVEDTNHNVIKENKYLHNIQSEYTY